MKIFGEMKFYFRAVVLASLAALSLLLLFRSLRKEDTVYVRALYTESSAGFSTDDSLFSEQWALFNNGSFSMEEEANDYPVYEDPFGTPYGPGEWVPPHIAIPIGRELLHIIRFLGAENDFSAFYGPGDMISTDGGAVAGTDINMEEAFSLYNGGVRDVVIALIDTGVDYTHEDLSDILWTNPGEIAGNGIDDDGNGYIDDVHGWNFFAGSNVIFTGMSDSHGTHGAGTILAATGNGIGIAGIANSEHIKIMPLKVLGGREGVGRTSDVIEAIHYAEAQGASICNISFGSSLDDPSVCEAIASSGMLFVAAGGNDGADIDVSPCYPASYDLDNIIAVANISYDGTLNESSNYSEKSIDLAAPGTYILSTTAFDSYSYMSGTSMSAPMVSAAAAVIYTHFGDISLSEVKSILLESAKSMDSLKGRTLTGGMLDLGAALRFDVSSLR